MAKLCAGSCAAFELCDADADPSEAVLRCRELKDEKSDRCWPRHRQPPRAEDGSLLAQALLPRARATTWTARCAASAPRSRCARESTAARRRRAPPHAGRAAAAARLLERDGLDERPAATCASACARVPAKAAACAAAPRWCTRRRACGRAPRAADPRGRRRRGGGAAAHERAAARPLAKGAAGRELRQPGGGGAHHRGGAAADAPRARRRADGVDPTSTTAMLPARDPTVRRATERAAYVSGYLTSTSSRCSWSSTRRATSRTSTTARRGLRGEPAQRHRHDDAGVPQRRLREWGGYTTFPKLDLKLSPVANAAIAFNDCLPTARRTCARSTAAARPPTAPRLRSTSGYAAVQDGLLGRGRGPRKCGERR